MSFFEVLSNFTLKELCLLLPNMKLSIGLIMVVERSEHDAKAKSVMQIIKKYFTTGICFDNCE